MVGRNSWPWPFCCLLKEMLSFINQSIFISFLWCYCCSCWFQFSSYVHNYAQILNFIILHFFYSCHDIDTMSGALTHIFPNYCATFFPMAVIMIVNPILYCCSTQDVRFIISVRLGQYTQRERNAVDGIKTKFLFIIITFYICWLPNLICGVLIWSIWLELPEKLIVSLWYVMVSVYFNISFIFLNILCKFLPCVIWKTAAWRYLHWPIYEY